jgi:two-component sensor histidine kinase
MVRMIVTQAGGDISVETDDGTRVCLRLPTEPRGRLAVSSPSD